MKIQRFIIILSLILFSLATCRNADPEAEIRFEAPKNFPAVAYNLNKNPVTNAGFALGKMLFYDGILSRDGSISCGSCHIQGSAFTHHGHDVSHGIDNKLGRRNAPSMQNLAWKTDFFWDGGVHDLDFQPIAPIENPVEMDEKLGNVLEKLRKTSKYPPLFEKAFGSSEITTARFLQALSQFMVMLVSANSRYDKYIRQEGEVLTDTELTGLQLFKEKCSTCHSSDLFTDNSFRNNGLALTPISDEGRAMITLNPQDKYKFKVPSLRNIEKTAPYMHDGRFYTLEVVLDHYENGMSDLPNLDPIFKQNNGKLGIPLSTDEKTKIIAFLKTLTDDTFIRDKRFAEF